jgi:hypothetical protein
MPFLGFKPLTAQLPSIKPTMILNGEFDFLMPRTLRQTLRLQIPESRDPGANCVPEKHRPADASGRSHCGC